LINLRTSDWRTGSGSPSWTSPIIRIRIRLSGTISNSYSFDGLTGGVVAQPAVLFTFDGSQSSLYSDAFAYMQTHNARGTGYIVTDWVDGMSKVTWVQLQEMYANGWTIGNNAKTGVNLTTMSLEDQIAELQAAQTALNDHNLANVDHVAYPFGAYNTDTLSAMQSLGMDTGRTLVSANFISPLGQPFELSQQSINRSTTLATAQSWIDTAIARQEILVITLNGISATPGTADWYLTNFQALVDYCISQGVPIITMDDLYQLQSGDITIPAAR
jgi:peptidoglycan/xylan/chitin deacetylase (PgdA/CDA1 family)